MTKRQECYEMEWYGRKLARWEKIKKEAESRIKKYKQKIKDRRNYTKKYLKTYRRKKNASSGSVPSAKN